MVICAEYLLEHFGGFMSGDGGGGGGGGGVDDRHLPSDLLIRAAVRNDAHQSAATVEGGGGKMRGGEWRQGQGRLIAHWSRFYSDSIELEKMVKPVSRVKDNVWRQYRHIRPNEN